MIRLGLVLTLVPGVAMADMQAQNTRYTCDRDIEVPVVYVNDPDQSLAVLLVEGGQFLLYAETAGTGARYSWPSDGSGYVWTTSDAGAMLYWRDGAAGTETAILACVQQ